MKQAIDSENGTRMIWHSAPSKFYAPHQQLFTEALPSGDQVFTLLHGYCWERTGNLLDAAAIHALLKANRGDTRALADKVNGEFIIVHANPDGSLVAFNDHSNFEPLYYHESPDVISIANRASLIRAVHPGLGKNNYVYAQMPVINHQVFRDTQVDGVRLLSMGEHLSVKENRLHVEWRSPLAVPGGKDDPAIRESLFAASRDEMANAVRIVVGQAPGLRLGLTGGRDSRLILAYLLASGLHKEVEFYTTGGDGHPDVVVARQLADEFGLRHRVESRDGIGNDLWSVEDILYRVAIHAYMTDGMASAYSLLEPGDLMAGVTVKGFQGELLRYYFDKDLSRDSFPDVAFLMKNHGHWDPLGIMRPEYMESLSTLIEQELSPWVQANLTFEDIPNIYWVSELMPKWQGPNREYNAGVSATFSPLNTPSFFKHAFCFEHSLRRTGYAYYQYLNAVCPRLCEIPFAVYGWRDSLRPYNVPGEIFKPAVQNKSRDPILGDWQHAINNSPTLRRTLRGLFADHRNSSMFEYVDFEKLDEALAKRNFPLTLMRNFWGFAGAFFAANDIKFDMPRCYRADNGANPVRVACSLKYGRQVSLSSQGLRVEAMIESRPGDKAIPEKVGALYGKIDPPPASTIDAGIGYRNRRRIKGYAYSREFPFARLNIELLQQGSRIAIIQANIPKPALAQRCMGDGKHAFEWTPPEDKPNLNAKTLTLRLCDSEVLVEEVRAATAE